jgi:hypothetical protein
MWLSNTIPTLIPSYYSHLFSVRGFVCENTCYYHVLVNHNVPHKISQELEVYPIFRLPLARGTAFHRALLRRQPLALPAEQLKPGTPWRREGEWLIGHQNGS